MFVKGIHYISDLRYVYFLKPIECLRDRCKNLLDILHRSSQKVNRFEIIHTDSEVDLVVCGEWYGNYSATGACGCLKIGQSITVRNMVHPDFHSAFGFSTVPMNSVSTHGA